MRRLALLFALLALPVFAQDINGVSIGGTAKRPTIINRSDKPVIGYRIQKNTSTGVSTPLHVLDLDSVAAGNPIQPGEERWLGLFTAFRVGGEGAPTSYDLKGVLFSDGECLCPDSAFQDFSKRTATARGLALLAKDNPDRYLSLERRTGKGAIRGASMDGVVVAVESAMATIVMEIRASKGEQEADAAIERFAALPELTKGEIR